jgi:hypothetical protein
MSGMSSPGSTGWTSSLSFQYTRDARRGCDAFRIHFQAPAGAWDARHRGATAWEGSPVMSTEEEPGGGCPRMSRP